MFYVELSIEVTFLNTYWWSKVNSDGDFFPAKQCTTRMG